MNRDNFDKHIGDLLRSAEEPVPQGAWQAINAQIGTGNTSSFGFGVAAVSGLLLLGALSVYSHLNEQVYDSEVVQIIETEADVNEAIGKDKPQEETTTETLAEWPEEGAAHETQAIASDVSNESHSNVFIYHNENGYEQSSEEALQEEGDIALRNMGIHSDLTQVPESIPATISMPESTEPKIAKPSQALQPAAEVMLRASIQTTNLSGYTPFEIDFKAHGNFNSVEWDFGPLGKSNKVSTRRTFENPGLYTIMLTGYNTEMNQMVTDMVTIEVHEGSNLVVPDSFTPNGDGVNDTFKAEGVNIENYTLSVIDSRGKVVFQTSNINESWAYDGPPLKSMDAYFAIIRATGVDGKEYNIQQRINIIF